MGVTKVWTRDPLPAWYKIGFKSPDTLIIEIERSAYEEVQGALRQETPLIKMHSAEWNLPPFIPPTEKVWGFGEVIRRRRGRIDDSWITLSCQLPKIGRRRQTTVTRPSSFAVRATLSSLFDLLWLWPSEDRQVEHAEQQLLVIEKLALGTEFGGGSLSASVTPAMCSFLNKFRGDAKLKEIIETMMDAYWYMFPPGKNERRHESAGFRAEYRQPQWVTLSVPGNARMLSPDNRHNDAPKQGYILCPHNVDTGLQQLALLVGLAMLHDLAAKNLYQR